MNPYYTDYSEYLAGCFPDTKVQKISVNAGFRCPNRDGTIGTGGCIYCNNESFSPAYCHAGLSVREQIEAGKMFFARKYPAMKYLVYFQNFTGSYAPDMSLADLERIYGDAAAVTDVAGLVIGTRPDCVDADFLHMVSGLGCKVMMEYGAESSHDDTLRRINRGHLWADTVSAVKLTHNAGLHCGLHFIAGLPGETPAHVLHTIDRAAALPINSIKLHHMQVLKGTPLAQKWERGETALHHFTPDSYLDLCVEVVRRVPRRIAIERFLAQSPPHMVLTPKWGLKNYQFTTLLLNRLKNLSD